MRPAFCWLFVLWAAVTGAAAPDEELSPEALPELTPGPDITLEEALRLADERNLSLAAARTELLVAQAGLYAAWSGLLPTAMGSLSYTHYDHADTATIGGATVETRKQDDLRGSLVVQLPLVQAQGWLGVVLGDGAVDLAQLQLEQVRQALLLTVAQAYFQALTARSLIEVYRDQIRSSQRHLAVVTIRHRSGTGTRLDVIRAQTELLTAREELLQAHTSLDNSRDTLARLIGADGLPMPAEIPEMAAPAADETDLIARATRQREDSLVAESRVALADDDLTASWMQFVPSLVASWQLNGQITDPSSFGSADKSRWFLGLSLSVPIYEHTRYADLDLKRAELSRAQLEAEDTRQRIALEIRQARREYESAVALVATARRKTMLADQSLELTEDAYENGTGSSLDVTDARRSSRAAAIDLATKRFAAQLTLLKLLRTAGEDMRSLGRSP